MIFNKLFFARKAMVINMEKYIDLHTHSVKSDGSMEPEDVVREAKKAGLAAIALSDHDNVEGVARAMAEGEKIGVEVVPAIELSAVSKTETHILGYYIDINNKNLLETLDNVKAVRERRQEDTCEKLRELGFDVTMEEARELAGSTILCRAHFARLMVNKNQVGSVKEAFDKYLSNGRPAYSSIQALSDVEAVELIKNAGGLSFVAHLNQTRRDDDDLREFLSGLKEKGLDGVEGYYTEYTEDMHRRYMALAKELGLQISGGTDFHGAMKPHISIGRGLGELRIPYSVLENIKSYRAKKGLTD